MKKSIIAAAVFFACVISAGADNREKPTTVDKLPAKAQEFLSQNFKGLTVAFVVEDPKMTGSEYEVTYTDRTEVDFNAIGEWTSVECKYDAVPQAVVPKQISDYLSGAGYGSQKIMKIEKKSYSWEIELSGGLEISFDTSFNVTEIDN